MNDLPVKTVNGATIFMRDVAHVRDGPPPQNNVVHVDSGRAVLSPVMKNGNASTLDVVQGVKDTMPPDQESASRCLRVDLLERPVGIRQGGGDRGGARGPHRRLPHQPDDPYVPGQLAFHRDHRHLDSAGGAGSADGLWATGQTLNIMTLGGLALAVGILVDDATVTIENMNWHLEHGKDVNTAIMDGARQIVQPAFVSLLCICIVFVPMLR